MTYYVDWTADREHERQQHDYEEWSEKVSRGYGGPGVAFVYAAWTADREELLRRGREKDNEIEETVERVEAQLRRAEAAEAERDKLSIHLKDANYNLDTVNRLSNENLQRAVKAEAERDKLAERVLVLEKAIVEHRLVKWGDLPVEKPHDVRLYAALEEEKR